MEDLRPTEGAADIDKRGERRRFEAKERGWRYTEDFGWRGWLLGRCGRTQLWPEESCVAVETGILNGLPLDAGLTMDA